MAGCRLRLVMQPISMSVSDTMLAILTSRKGPISRFVVLVFFCFLFFRYQPSSLPEGIRVITWNGEYFLLGTFDGHIVKYDGETFFLLEHFETPISDIVWNRTHWLIGGKNLFATYDGMHFNVISSDYDISKITCGKDYCMIHSPDKKIGLLTYEGTNLETLTALVQEAFGEEFWIEEISCTREYCLAVINDTLIKYDGNSFFSQDVPAEFEITSLAWCGEYWLLGGRKLGESALFQYDGDTFTEVVYPGDIFHISGGNVPFNYITPTKIAWNGKYWLIDTAYSLVIYDGSRFEEIEYNTIGPYTPYRIKEMEWNGKYWLLVYSLAGTEGSALGRLEEGKFEWLSFMQSRQWPPISSVSWNDNYWLIGFNYPKTEVVLLMYDGSTFTDITSDFSTILEAPPPQENKYVILAIFVLLIVISVILWNRNRFR